MWGWGKKSVLAWGLILSGGAGADTIVNLSAFKGEGAADRLAVVIGLKAPETDAAGGWQNLNDYIAQVQDRALQELGWRNFNDLVRYRNIPALARRVTRKELQQLLHAPRVEAVYQDSRFAASLEHSTARIQLQPLLAQAAGGAGQALAVIDTGVDRRHGFFAGRIVAEACFSRANNCPNGQSIMIGVDAAQPCADQCSHGTHVAGIAAGRNGNFTGVAPDAGIVAVNVFDRDPATGGRGASFSVILQALDWLYQNRRRLNLAALNLSLGSGEFGGDCDRALLPLKRLVDLFRRDGIATVAAAGNEHLPRQINAPACLSNVISVGALNYQGRVAAYSNASPQLTLLAPGGGAGVLFLQCPAAVIAANRAPPWRRPMWPGPGCCCGPLTPTPATRNWSRGWSAAAGCATRATASVTQPCS